MKRFIFCFFLVLFFFIGAAGAYACSCDGQLSADNFQRSDFVASAKILKVTPDPEDKDYHDAEIEVISLYKGERLRKIKILSALNSSCGFLPRVNSTWIIFASVWHQQLSFGFCSGSFRIDRKFNTLYPGSAGSYRRLLALKQGVLSYLRDNHISDPNPNELKVSNVDLESVKGYKNNSSFAVFEVDVNADLSVSGLKMIREFQNAALNKAVLAGMEKGLSFAKSLDKPDITAAKVLVFCYYYPAEGSSESFVSLFEE